MRGPVDSHALVRHTVCITWTFPSLFTNQAVFPPTPLLFERIGLLQHFLQCPGVAGTNITASSPLSLVPIISLSRFFCFSLVFPPPFESMHWSLFFQFSLLSCSEGLDSRVNHFIPELLVESRILHSQNHLLEFLHYICPG